MKKNMLFLFLIICWIDFIIGYRLVIAENNNKSQQFEEFLKFPDDQKRKIIVKSFEERINKSQNIYYKLDLTIGTAKNIQSVSDNNVDFFFKRNYERWQLGKSYKVKMEMFKGMDSQPLEWITDAYDAKNGENRGIFRSSSLKDKNFGTINTIQDITTADDIYLYWLQNSFFSESSMEKNSFIFVYLLDHSKDWKFFTTEKENQIGLEVKYQPDYALFNFKSCDGTLKVSLNFTKGFMPELSEIHWDAIWANNKNEKAWRDEKFIVEKSSKVGDIWMPTQLTMILRTSSVPDAFSISKVNIYEIKYDQVTPQDVVLIFPEGTSVVDAINGISYKTDANGEPIASTKEFLYGLDPSQIKMPEREHSKANYVLIVTGLLLILTAIYLMFHKNKKAS